MADFDTSAAKAASLRRAATILPNIQAAYEAMKVVRGLMALYTANTDPAYNAVVNQLYTLAERTKLATIASDANTLITNWETNYLPVVQQ